MMLRHRQPMQQISGCLSIDGDLFFPIFYLLWKKYPAQKYGKTRTSYAQFLCVNLCMKSFRLCMRDKKCN